MTDSTPQGELFPRPLVPDGTAVVNERCVVRTQDGHRIVIVASIPLWHYEEGDAMAEAYAMVSLVEQGWADQNDVARAFACSARTLRRHQRRFEEGGLAALGRAAGCPKGTARLAPSRATLIGDLRAQGVSHRGIASRVGVTERAVRKSLRRMGWGLSDPAQGTLALDAGGADPNLSASRSHPGESHAPTSGDRVAVGALPPLVTNAVVEPEPSADPNLSALAWPAALRDSDGIDPANRTFDRLMAYLGLLDDAAPLFRAGSRVPGAGVLLAVPSLLASGVLDCAREVYGGIGPAFYGLRTTIVSLLLMALLRIRRPEGLKEHSPQDLGRILGLDRAPEVKTLRRKLVRLGALNGAARFSRALALRRVAVRGATMGFLYVDGHVRVYHGRHTIPKAHVARMRIAMSGTTDYWVNDTEGDPLFVVTAEANAGLVKMLPPILEEVRALVGERRVTMVFDRGGFSPKLFVDLIAAGFDVLTYRKGKSARVPRRSFKDHTGTHRAQEVTYSLADQEVRLLKGRLRMRQVTRRMPDGHQTPILTSRRDLSTFEVAHRMFARWQQENFFKYLREEYALDALTEYATEPDDAQREVPNPRWRDADIRLREARAKLANLQTEYGRAALANAESRRRTMRGFKIAQGAVLGRKIREGVKRCKDLEARRASIPRRVPVGRAVQAEVVKLAAEKKHLTNILKMVAYQAESDLVAGVSPHYKRARHEGRTLIQSALRSAADLAVTKTQLRVTLAPLSSPHRTCAIRALCERLNDADVRFPGTELTLRFDVAGPQVPRKADTR